MKTIIGFVFVALLFTGFTSITTPAQADTNSCTKEAKAVHLKALTTASNAVVARVFDEAWKTAHNTAFNNAWGGITATKDVLRASNAGLTAAYDKTPKAILDALWADPKFTAAMEAAHNAGCIK